MADDEVRSLCPTLAPREQSLVVVELGKKQQWKAPGTGLEGAFSLIYFPSVCKIRRPQAPG